MKKIVLLLVLLVLAGCVQFPEEEQETSKADDIFEPVGTQVTATETTQVTTTTAPNPLAPLPQQNKTSNIAPRPKAIVPNATNTTSSSNKTQKQMQFTTDYMSIAEGETKYVYIKSP